MSSKGILFAEAIASFNLIFGSEGNSDKFIEQDASDLPEDLDTSRDSCIQRIGQCLSVMRDAYATEMRRSTMLQEFLVNELNHTEELQASLRNVKEELNVTVKQRENYKKKCESQLAELEMLTVSKAGVGNNNHASQMSQSAADSQTMLLDQMLMGKFIGKKFAGNNQCMYSSRGVFPHLF